MEISYQKLTFRLIVLAFIGAACYGIYIYFPNWRYENAFSQISVGDSKEKVISLYGKSAKIENCHYIIYSDVSWETKNKCTEMHWYIGFVEEWGFVFDNEGTVIHTVHSVSG